MDTLADLDGSDDVSHRHLIEFLLPQQFATKEEADVFYITHIIGTILALALLALSAGLFLGLMTLDAFDLRIIERSSLDEDDKLYAAALYPVVKDRHFLLVTLLLLDALAYETLPLFLDKLLPSWLVLLLSTTLVLLFGEIVPSAIFMGPQQLALAYYMLPLVKILMTVLYPVAKPCSILLDYVVHGPNGEDETQEEYNREELSALVNLQYERRIKKKGAKSTKTERKFPIRASPHWGALKQEMFEAVNDRTSDDDNNAHIFQELTAPLERQEVDVVVGALQMKTKVATDVYTPLRHVYAIPDDLVLDRACMTEIYVQGYSRVPVYRNIPGRDKETNRACVIGFLMTRQLMMIDWDHERSVSTLPLVRPDAVSPRQNLVDLLKLLKSGGSLMAFVCARSDLANRALTAGRPLPVESGFMGIVTLEDILESILQTKIYDEFDIRDRDRAVAKLTKWAAEKLQSFARKSVAKRRFSGNAKTLSITAPPTEDTPLLNRNDQKDQNGDMV